MLDIVDYNGGVFGLAGDDAHAAMTAATRSNLRIYPIDPAGLPPDYVPLEAIGAFRSLGEATGGFALVNSNSFTEAFERIVRENSTYYMLAFNSTYEKEDGRYVRLQVKVKRPGLTVHAREGYVAPTRRLRQAQEKARTGVPTSAVSMALASPLATSGIPIRVFATPFKGRGRNAAVALALELDAASLGLEDRDGVLSGKVDVRYVATDAKRKVYPELAQLGLGGSEVRPSGPGAPRAHPRARRLRARAAAGAISAARRGRLRARRRKRRVRPRGAGLERRATRHEWGDADFAVRAHGADAHSKSGAESSKAVKCYGELCKAPVSTSVVEVPLTPSITVPLLRDGTPGSPTTQREFGAGDQLVLVAEVYDNTKPRANDPPHAITLTTDLRDAAAR